MISGYIVGDTELIAKFSGLMGGGLQRSVAREVLRLAIMLDRLVKQKLSGQVLNVRTGVLRSSTHYRLRESSTEVTATEGTNVKYAPPHEYGVGHSWLIEAKNAQALRFQVGGQTIFRKSVTHPGLPERSFLRSSLREMEPQIKAGLEHAVGEALHR